MTGKFHVGPLAADALSFGEAVDTILSARDQSRHLSVHFCTAHTVVEASRSDALRQALNDPSSLNTSDGMPLVWIGRLQGRKVERVYGPETMLAVLDRGRSLGYRHYFFGGTADTVQLLIEKMRARFPGLCVAGFEAPPFRQLTPEEDRGVVQRMNGARPDCVWVGLGAPKQDLWVSEHRGRLSASALLAVGAAFDFHSGTKRQAPYWMQRSGLEWLFRLGSEPRRLWRRYTVVNVVFLSIVGREAIRGVLRRIVPTTSGRAP